MDDLTTWSLLVGTVAPLAIAVAQRPRWSNTARSVISILFCAVAGLGTAYLDGSLVMGKPLTFSAVIHSVLATTLAAQVTYRNVWKPTGVARAIEQATSPSDSALTR